MTDRDIAVLLDRQLRGKIFGLRSATLDGGTIHLIYADGSEGEVTLGIPSDGITIQSVSGSYNTLTVSLSSGKALRLTDYVYGEREAILATRLKAPYIATDTEREYCVTGDESVRLYPSIQLAIYHLHTTIQKYKVDADTRLGIGEVQLTDDEGIHRIMLDHGVTTELPDGNRIEIDPDGTVYLHNVSKQAVTFADYPIDLTQELSYRETDLQPWGSKESATAFITS